MHVICMRRGQRRGQRDPCLTTPDHEGSSLGETQAKGHAAYLKRPATTGDTPVAKRALRALQMRP